MRLKQDKDSMQIKRATLLIFGEEFVSEFTSSVDKVGNV